MKRSRLRSTSRSKSPPRSGPRPQSHFESQSQSQSDSPSASKSQPSARSRPFRFRILIAGKANTGKTTIANKICSETDIPIVRDQYGNEIHSLDSLKPTSGRGLHDINHEITYPGWPGFVFHDSAGLEAGSIDEVKLIVDFIKRRARMEKEEALHIICSLIWTWEKASPTSYIGLDHPANIAAPAVPVVVAFTKYDALELKAEGELGRENPTDEPTEQEISARADLLFQQHFLKRVMAAPHPPAAYVRLKGMSNTPVAKIMSLMLFTADLDTQDGDCTELTRQTVSVLEDEHLQGR
ncbi:hypothetical protein FRB96_007783, partial [Tulasnella sp. 330]